MSDRLLRIEALEDRSMLSCLAGASQVITLTGEQTERYSETGLPDGTAVDATDASWFALDDTLIKIRDSNDFCLHGGLVEHDFALDAPWDDSHSARSMRLYNSPNAIIEDVHFNNSGDGISIFAGSEDFTIRNTLFTDMRDDAIESDDLQGGVIEDTLIESTYVGFAARPRSDNTFDGSGNTWVIQDTLIRLRPQIGVYKGVSPGTGGFFKWDELAPQIQVHDSIFRADQLTNHQDLGFDPDGKLAGASNNIVVWLGEGAYPEPLPPGFTLTTDVSVWDNAVTQWMNRHGRGNGLPADGNGDGMVGAADYTLWANNFGATGLNVVGDYNFNGTVDASDYTVWANSFGSVPAAPSSASASATAAPAPAPASATTQQRDFALMLWYYDLAHEDDDEPELLR